MSFYQCEKDNTVITNNIEPPIKTKINSVS